MLVLTRKTKQSIMIGEEIEVTVLAVMGDKVRIGIEAPRSVPVFRTEVYLEMRAEAGEPAEGTRREVEEALTQLQTPPSENGPE